MAGEVLGVEDKEAEEETVVGVAEQVEEEEVEVKIMVKVVKEVVTGGPTSPSMRIIPRIQSVKNIMFLGKVLIGVKSQLHVRGRTSGSRRASNETVTNLIFMTYKTLCIKASRNKYIQPLT